MEDISDHAKKKAKADQKRSRNPRRHEGAHQTECNEGSRSKRLQDRRGNVAALGILAYEDALQDGACSDERRSNEL